MSPPPLPYRVAFSTPWFEIEESIPERPDELPYYRMTGPDGVICLPFTAEGDVVMIRQYRPNIDRVTLEIPAGSIDGDESVLHAAEREILEETGHRCAVLVPLGHGRLYLSRTNHVEHFVLGLDARIDANAVIETGIELSVMSRPDLRRMVQQDQFEHTAALSFLGLASAKLGIDLLQDSMSLIRERVAERAERKTAHGC